MEDLARRDLSYPVNGQEVLFPDRVITGREALTKSGHVPASEYQLILVRDGRTHLSIPTTISTSRFRRAGRSAPSRRTAPSASPSMGWGRSGAPRTWRWTSS